MFQNEFVYLQLHVLNPVSERLGVRLSPLTARVRERENVFVHRVTEEQPPHIEAGVADGWKTEERARVLKKSTRSIQQQLAPYMS